MLEKKCDKCQKTLDLEFFHKKKLGKHGRNNNCKKCENAMRNKSYDYSKLERKRELREIHQKKNDIFYWNRRARKSNELANTRCGTTCKISGEDIMNLYNLNSKCTYCNIELENKDAYIDHVIPLVQKGEHHISNISISCKRCNETKNSKDDKEFFLYIESIYKRLLPRYKKAE